MLLTRRSLLPVTLGAALAAGRAAPTLAAAAAEDQLWRAIGDGQAVAIMRHALAPGTGDPASFRIDDCSTQRNLSEQGRAQARAIGERFRANGIGQAEVRSSQWCRCLETAELLELGPVEEMPALNSFFGNRAEGPRQTAALRRSLASSTTGRPLVLVTHQVNISALTRVYPASGEIVVVRSGGHGSIRVAGTIRTGAG